MTEPRAPLATLQAAARRSAADRPQDRRLKPAPRPGTPLKAKAAGGMSLTAPRTMALALILGCFAASGAIRLTEMSQNGDLGRIVAASSGSWFETAAAADATTAPGPASAGPQDSAAAELDAPSAVANAADMRSAEAAMGAAIAAGDIETASTREAEAADKPERPLAAAPEAGEAARLIAALRQRETELDEYAAKLAERNEALTLAAERLETRMRELERSKEAFSALVATVDQAADRDVSHLISMYEKMKPKEAGPLFDTMDPGFAAGFLARMKPDRASAIMAQMSTDRAYAVSLQLAGRNVRREPGAR